MAIVRKTIVNTEHQDARTASEIDGGCDTDARQAIGDPFRSERERDFAVGSVRRALIEGVQSGEPQRFDFAAFKQSKTAQLDRAPPVDRA